MLVASMMQMCVFFSATGRNVAAVSLQKCSTSFAACFPTFIFPPTPFSPALPLESVSSHPPVEAGMCLCHAEEDFHSIQLPFKWRLSVMTCVGKTEAVHKAFYKPLLKNASPSYLPAPPPSNPQFSFAAATSSNAALCLPRSVLALFS